jgi:hypothetical protein
MGSHDEHTRCVLIEARGLFMFGVPHRSSIYIQRGPNDLVGFCGARKAMNLSCAGRRACDGHYCRPSEPILDYDHVNSPQLLRCGWGPRLQVYLYRSKHRLVSLTLNGWDFGPFDGCKDRDQYSRLSGPKCAGGHATSQQAKILSTIEYLP